MQEKEKSGGGGGGGVKRPGSGGGRGKAKRTVSQTSLGKGRGKGGGGGGGGGDVVLKMEINHNQRWMGGGGGAASINNNKANPPPPHTLPPVKGLSNNNASSTLPPLPMNTFAFPSLEEGGRPGSGDKKRKSSWSSSINSFTDSLWSDDELERPRQGKKKPLKPAKVGHSAVAQHAPAALPMVHQHREKSDIDDVLDDLDFGLPAGDVTRPKNPPSGRFGGGGGGGFGGFPSSQRKPQVGGNHIYKPVTNLAGSPDFKCQYSAHMSLPGKWRELPIEHSQLASVMGLFPQDWYRRVLGRLDWSATGLPGEKVAVDVGADDALTNCYAQLIMACYSAFDTLGQSPLGSSV